MSPECRRWAANPSLVARRLGRWTAGVVWILVVALPTGRAAAQSVEPPTFLLKWGSQGSGDGQFDSPAAMAIDAMGNLYVTELGNRRVQKFSNDGAFLLKWNGPGFGGDQFDLPRDVEAHGQRVYVNDRGNIGVFAQDGAWVDSIVVKGLLVAVDPTGQWLYAARSDSVYKYTIDGTLVTGWATLVSSETTNAGITVGPSGNVYVTEIWGDMVWKFAPDGTFLKTWGSGPGAGDGEFRSPIGITTDADENVYVCDGGNNRIQKFTSEGVFLTKWGRVGTGDGEFGGPLDIAIDGDGNIFVLEAVGRVQKFGDVPTLVAPTTWGRMKLRYLPTGETHATEEQAKP